MTLNQLRYFQALAQIGHYRQAADSLYISQPSLSKAIASLEDELGVRLFERNSRNIRLTDAGKNFLSYVSQALKTIDQGVEETKRVSLKKETISIGCIAPALIPYLAPMMKKYQETVHKKLHYLTRTGISEDLLKDLVGGLYDVVFCTCVDNIKKVTFTKVCALPYYVVVRRDNALAKKSAVRPEELDGCPMLFTEASSYVQRIQELLDYYHVHPIPSGLSNEESGLVGMVEAGIGVFISTDYPQVHSENTTLVPLEQDHFLRYIYMAVAEDRSVSPSAQKLISFIQHNSELFSQR